MGEFFAHLFDTSDFPARWQCGSWSAGIGWLHIVADVVTWLAYMAIPFGMVYIMRRRAVPFPKLLWLFVAFIGFCGFGHLMEAVIFWWPAYRFAGLLKLMTAVTSVATVIVGLRMAGPLLAHPSAPELLAELDTLRRRNSQQITELFRTAFDSAPCGMLLISETGAVLLANTYACRLFGWAPEELLGRPVEDLVPHAIRERHVQLRNDYFRDPSKREMAAGRDLTAIRRDGTEIAVEVLLSPIVLDDGTRAAISTIVDVTPRKLADIERQRHAEELERRNKALDEFTYLVSHDLKAPLRAISMVSDWLVTDHAESLGEEGCKHLAAIRQRTRRMDQLIQGALTYARAGREQGTLEPIGSAEILAEVVRMLQPGLGTVIAAVSELPDLVYDRDHFTKILLNLVGNAVKHGRREGCRVEVAAVDRGNVYEFLVRDNGPGIDAEHHERIFRMFQRLPGAAEDSTGVGLAIVRTLVERHGGRVWVESATGAGAAFHFTIPKLAPARRPTAITASTAVAAEAAHRS